MAEQKNEVQVTFSDMLNDRLVSVESALPNDFNKVRFVQNAMAVLNGNPGLSKCNKSSIMAGLMKGAYLGLDFANKEAYLIPYGSDVQFQTSYIGEIKFVKKYSIRHIKDIYAEVIRENDEFSRSIVDGQQKFTFNQKLGGGAVVGVFAVCLFEDGGIQLELMSIDDVNSVRNNYSKQSQGKTWTNSFNEMAKKVCLRRLCKHINTDFESVEARQAWDEGSGMEFSNSQRVGSPDTVVNPFASTTTDDANVIIQAEGVEIVDGD